MSATVKSKTIESVGEDRVRVSGDVTLAELYDAVPDRELYVEPLSASQALGAFLAEGGLGFGSLGHGTFGGQLCRVKSAYGGLDFTYGLGTSPLYNTGYPLQRIMEGPTSDLLAGDFEEASEMVLLTRGRAGVALDHSPAEAPELPGADGAENVFFANAAAAGAMGLPGAGVMKVRRANGKPDGAWSKRFVLDSTPEGHAKLLVLMQASGAKALFDAHKAKHADGVFLALAVHTGVFVVASAPAEGVEDLAKTAADLPLTWRLGA
jgi:hypothetical protein